jgi:hypothetical protein
MARSVDIQLGQEEDESGNIWSRDRVANVTEGDVADYITDKINDYDQKELKGVNLFEYWRSDFENFTLAAYKKTTAKTKLLRDYLLDNGIWIPKNRRPIADNLIASSKLWVAWPIDTHDLQNQP